MKGDPAFPAFRPQSAGTTATCPLSPLDMQWPALSLQCKPWVAQLSLGTRIRTCQKALICRLPFRILHSGSYNPETWLQILVLEIWGQGWPGRGVLWRFLETELWLIFPSLWAQGLERSVHTGKNLRKINRWRTYTLRPVLPVPPQLRQASAYTHTHSHTHTLSLWFRLGSVQQWFLVKWFN